MGGPLLSSAPFLLGGLLLSGGRLLSGGPLLYGSPLVDIPFQLANNVLCKHCRKMKETRPYQIGNQCERRGGLMVILRWISILFRGE